jgi:hypothetical protein
MSAATSCSSRLLTTPLLPPLPPLLPLLLSKLPSADSAAP